MESMASWQKMDAEQRKLEFEMKEMEHGLLKSEEIKGRIWALLEDENNIKAGLSKDSVTNLLADLKVTSKLHLDFLDNTDIAAIELLTSILMTLSL